MPFVSMFELGATGNGLSPANSLRLEQIEKQDVAWCVSSSVAKWSRIALAVLLCLFLQGISCAADVPSSSELEFFEKKIRPVLVENCYSCHSSEAQAKGKLKGGLFVDSREGLRVGGETGPAIVPGKPESGTLLKALRYEGLEMPPQKQLPAATVADFEQWISRGAADPRDGALVAVRRSMDLSEARQFWSFRPVQNAPAPHVKMDLWPRNEIDHWVLAKLDQKGLVPVGDADRRTLVRRLYFDLIGLPPPMERVDSFLRDESPQAIERLVDELLASRHFGEKWGRHWLDLARYSESNGRDRNIVWHHAWRYRDWVIDALNRDLPFDEFVRMQIAGDLLSVQKGLRQVGMTESSLDEQREKTLQSERLIAVGFLALGPKAFEERKVEVFRMDMIDEQIDVISRSLLGLSVACARCHDHKFDPIPTREYYALAGIFRSTQPMYGLGPMGTKCLHDTELQVIDLDHNSPTPTVEELNSVEVDPPLSALIPVASSHREAIRARIQERNDARSSRYRVVRQVASLKSQLTKPDADKEMIESQIASLETEVKEWDIKVKRLEEDVKDHESNPPLQPEFAMSARDGKIEECRIHIRGDTTNLGDSVPRGFLGVVDLPEVISIPADASGRLQLAFWLTHPKHPLTPRVAVNRVWQHLFGRGVVATPDDFGTSGSPPSHPELLDHLASRFVAEGWSMKKLIRHIVLSRTYRLSSSSLASNQMADPENTLLWRHSPRRLDAEMFRDSVLFVTSQLDPTPRSKSIVGELHPFKEPEFFSWSLHLKQEQMEHYHRSVYLPIVRGNLPEALKLFDFADPSVPVGRRDESVVPAQASFLMNSPWMILHARQLARSICDETADNGRRLERCYQQILNRLPTDEERQRITSFFVAADEESFSSPKKSPDDQTLDRWTSIVQSLLGSIEFRYSF